MFAVVKRHDGSFSAHPRFRDEYDTECVLALALEGRRNCADGGRYVTFASVLEVFRLGIPWAIEFGFCSPHDDDGNGETLDRAWLEALTTYADPGHSFVRHHPNAAA